MSFHVFSGVLNIFCSCKNISPARPLMHEVNLMIRDGRYGQGMDFMDVRYDCSVIAVISVDVKRRLWLWNASLRPQKNRSWGPKRWVVILKKYLELLNLYFLNLIAEHQFWVLWWDLNRFDIWALSWCLAVVLMAPWFCAKIRLISPSANFSTSRLTVKPLSLSLEMITYTVALPAVMWRFLQPWDCQKDLAPAEMVCVEMHRANFRKARSICGRLSKTSLHLRSNNFTPCTSTRGWTGRAPRCPGGISTLFEHQVLQGLANFVTQEVKPWQQDGQAVALLSKSRGPHRIMLFLQHNVQDAVDAGRLAINVLSSMALVPWCWNQSWPMTADGVRIPSCWHFLNPLSIEWFVCWFGSTNLTLKKWHFLPAYQECVHLHKSENG